MMYRKLFDVLSRCSQVRVLTHELSGPKQSWWFRIRRILAKHDHSSFESSAANPYRRTADSRVSPSQVNALKRVLSVIRNIVACTPGDTFVFSKHATIAF